MNAFNGTPGPWQVVNGTDIFTRLGGRNASGVEAAWNDGWHIADCDMGPSFTEEGKADIPYAEKMANARLISAAPELLEALHVVSECGDPCKVSLYDEEGIEGWRWTHPDGREWEETGEWCEGPPLHPVARAAIAKATGEQS